MLLAIVAANSAAEQARVQSDMQHMAETCVQELSTQREELMADESLLRLQASSWPRKKTPIARCARASTTWAR